MIDTRMIKMADHASNTIDIIEYCITNKKIVQALVLLYSLIDTLAWLNCKDNKSVRNRFENWVNEYLLSQGTLNCSATDIYSARCAIVHNNTSESDLSNSNQAKQVLYAYGSVKTKHLSDVLEELKYPNCIVVHIDNMLNCFREATVMFFTESDDDELILKKAEKILNNFSVNLLKECRQP